jgi:hypothetical protein
MIMDSFEGNQAEIDLDLVDNGIPLTERYKENLNNWNIIVNRMH